MFDRSTYVHRRAELKRRLGSGIALLLGNTESPMNYPANPYPFRQDGTFLYYIGLNEPRLAAVVDVDADATTLFGDDATMDDVVWTGPQPTVAERAERVGIASTAPLADLADTLSAAQRDGRPIHFLPPYRAEHQATLHNLLGIHSDTLSHSVSDAFIDAVVAQREHKTQAEVEEIEAAVAISHAMHTTAMRETRPGRQEQEVVGEVTGVMRARGGHFSFPMIFSTDGQTLHNHHYGNRMATGQLVVHDSGTTSPEHYASDITRTIPVGGRFTDRQRPLYQAVLDAQLAAIDGMRPGVAFKDLHLTAARVLTTALADLGLMRGDTDEAVAAGAHALFFPHGLGHLMGLDVHDLEGLGEDRVGYGDAFARSDQFGLAFLRFARTLEPGHVLTVEPGLYFIPELIDSWKAEGRHAAFIDYDAIDDYRDGGGIRIEDDVLVTDSGHRVLGPPIPKTVDEVEALVPDA